VFNISLLDILELLLTWIITLESCGLEEVFVVLWLFEDVQCHFECCILELDYKINEHFVLNLRNCKLFSYFPELFGHPVRYNRHIFQIVDISFNVWDLLCKKTRQPQFTPWGSLLIFINKCQTYNFADCWIEAGIDFDCFSLCMLFYESECIMCPRIHERMESFVDEVQKTTRWPYITFEWIFLVLKLFGWSINGCPFV